MQKVFSDTRHDFHSIDVQTCWSCMLQTVQSAYRCLHVPKSVESRVLELGRVSTTQTDWEIATCLSSFLEKIAFVTENKSGRKYITISLGVVVYSMLKINCIKAKNDECETKRDVAALM